MSVKISEATQASLTSVLNYIENTSELIKCMVVTRTGIKVAPDMDADTYSASSAALIDLGERVVSSLDHGSLQELVINALGGYVILVSVGKEYMLLGATSAALKMGYYLPYIREKAWEMEHIIFGGEEMVSEDQAAPVEESVPPEEKSSPKITGDVIKEADMKAMNDVLAAFDEFGIDDDFSTSLGGDAVPTVGISREELDSINAQLHAGESIPEISTSISPPLAEPAKQGPVVEEPTPDSVQGKEEPCPIPLEPGEVPPYPLDPSELTPLEGDQQPVEATSTVVDEVPAPSPEPAAVEPSTEPAAVEQSPVPAAEPASPDTGAPPFFEDASEYDFDFNSEVKKEVVIPEKDSMADALKALGWEEEDDN